MGQGRSVTIPRRKAHCVLSKRMEQFDALPAEVRECLQSHKFNIYPTELLFDMLDMGLIISALNGLKAIESKELDARAMVQIWGVTGHPQAIVNGPSPADLGL